MKTLSILFTIIILCLKLSAQVTENSERANALYFEAYGNNLYYGINYDCRFLKQSKGLGGSLGFGAFQNISNDTEWIDDPNGGYLIARRENSNFYASTLMINYLWGKGPHSVEAGAGAVLFTARNFGYGFVRGDEDQFSSVFGTLSMMYRLHLPKSLFLRVGWAPFFGEANDGFVFIPYQFGLSIGYAFQ